MSKQKTVQKKQTAHKGPPPKAHASESKQSYSLFTTVMLFFTYFVILLLVVSMIYMFGPQLINDTMAWLIPLGGAALLTFLHIYLRWPKPNL